MRTRNQYCPVCQQITPHTYQNGSFLVFFMLFLCGGFPALFYLIYMIARGKNSAHCTVDHKVLEAQRTTERTRELVAMIAAAQMASRAPADTQQQRDASTRGTGFMTRG